jgi:hypothetical protein
MLEREESLSGEIWTDPVDLVNRYSPKGLESDVVHWFHPDVIQTASLEIEALDTFLKKIFGEFEHYLATNKDEQIQTLAKFLDEELPAIMLEWLGEVYRPLSIFPNEFEFTPENREAFLKRIGEFVLFGHLKQTGDILPYDIPSRAPFPLTVQMSVRRKTLRSGARSLTPIRGHRLKTRRVRFLLPSGDTTSK